MATTVPALAPISRAILLPRRCGMSNQPALFQERINPSPHSCVTAWATRVMALWGRAPSEFPSRYTTPAGNKNWARRWRSGSRVSSARQSGKVVIEVMRNSGKVVRPKCQHVLVQRAQYRAHRAGVSMGQLEGQGDQLVVALGYVVEHQVLQHPQVVVQ